MSKISPKTTSPTLKTVSPVVKTTEMRAKKKRYEKFFLFFQHGRKNVQVMPAEQKQHLFRANSLRTHHEKNETLAEPKGQSPEHSAQKNKPLASLDVLIVSGYAEQQEVMTRLKTMQAVLQNALIIDTNQLQTLNEEMLELQQDAEKLLCTLRQARGTIEIQKIAVSILKELTLVANTLSERSQSQLKSMPKWKQSIYRLFDHAALTVPFARKWQRKLHVVHAAIVMPLMKGQRSEHRHMLMLENMHKRIKKLGSDFRECSGSIPQGSFQVFASKEAQKSLSDFLQSYEGDLENKKYGVDETGLSFLLIQDLLRRTSMVLEKQGDEVDLITQHAQGTQDERIAHMKTELMNFLPHLTEKRKNLFSILLSQVPGSGINVGLMNNDMPKILGKKGAFSPSEGMGGEQEKATLDYRVHKREDDAVVITLIHRAPHPILSIFDSEGLEEDHMYGANSNTEYRVSFVVPRDAESMRDVSLETMNYQFDLQEL